MLAERDRRQERRLRYLDEELRRSRERAEYYTRRVTELERERTELVSPEEKPASDTTGTAGALGGLAELVKGLKPETLQQIGQAFQGVNLQPMLGALAPALAPALAGIAAGSGAAEGALPAPVAERPVAPAVTGSALDGLSEVLTYLGNNPLPQGRRWNLKDVTGVLQLTRSPNVRTLLQAAGSLTGALKGGGALLSALLGLGGTTGPAPATPAPAAENLAPAPIRFRRPEGPPAIAQPWRGAATG